MAVTSAICVTNSASSAYLRRDIRRDHPPRSFTRGASACVSANIAAHELSVPRSKLAFHAERCRTEYADPLMWTHPVNGSVYEVRWRCASAVRSACRGARRGRGRVEIAPRLRPESAENAPRPRLVREELAVPSRIESGEDLRRDRARRVLDVEDHLGVDGGSHGNGLCSVDRG